MNPTQTAGTVPGPTVTESNPKPIVERELLSHEFLQAHREMVEAVKMSSTSLDNAVAALTAVEAQRKHNPIIDSGVSRLDVDPEEVGSLDQIFQINPVSDAHRDLMELNNKAFLACVVARCKANRNRNDGDRIPYEAMRAQLQRLPEVQRLNKGLKRANIWHPSVATAGAEYVPVMVSSTLTDIHRLPVRLLGAIQQIEIPDGVGQLNLPANTTGGAAAVTIDSWTNSATVPSPEGTTAANNPATAVVNLKPVIHKRVMAFRLEEVDDASIAVLQAGVNAASLDLMEAWEGAIINGQTLDDASFDITFQGANIGTYANGYIPSGVVSAGLRKYGFGLGVNVIDAANGAFSLATFEQMRGQLGDFGVQPDELAFVGRAQSYFNLLKDATIKPIYSFGAQASLPRGAVDAVYGIPVYTSKQMPLVAGTGLIATSGNTQGTALMFNRTRWYVGVKHNIEIKMLDLVGSYAIAMYAFARHAIGFVPPVTDKHTCYAFDLLPTG